MKNSRKIPEEADSSTAQLVNCGTAVSDINSPVLLENVLLSNNKTNFNASSPQRFTLKMPQLTTSSI